MSTQHGAPPQHSVAARRREVVQSSTRTREAYASGASCAATNPTITQMATVAMVPTIRQHRRRCQHAFGDNGGYKGVKMPPADPQDWYALVKALAEHLVWRYGLPEVSTWKFEVWNEMWGVDFPDPYMSLYNASARALKAVDSALKVGGPATMQTLYVPEFIANASAHGIPVDFVSCNFLQDFR